MWLNLYIHSISAKKILLSSWETFVYRNLKNDRISFLGQIDVETAVDIIPNDDLISLLVNM